jgi:hypothetical protein
MFCFPEALLDVHKRQCRARCDVLRQYAVPFLDRLQLHIADAALFIHGGGLDRNGFCFAFCLGDTRLRFKLYAFKIAFDRLRCLPDFAAALAIDTLLFLKWSIKCP